MIGGQALTLIDRGSLSIKNDIIDYCLRHEVDRHTLFFRNDTIYADDMFDSSYAYIYRLMSFELCSEVFDEFFKTVISHKEFIKYLIQNYSIASDDMIEKFIKILKQKLKATDLRAREDMMIERIDKILKARQSSTALDSNTTEKAKSTPVADDVMSMLVDFK